MSEKGDLQKRGVQPGTQEETAVRSHASVIGTVMRSRIGDSHLMNQLQMILNNEVSDRPPRERTGDPVRPVRKTSEARRAYLRRYYEANKEKAREYQRRYNLMHKKKVRMASKLDGASRLRGAVRETFNASDIMQSPTEKSVRILTLILSGERYFTM